MLIAVVEDEEKIRGMIRSYLQNEGYEIVEAEDGTTAVELIKAQKVDLVLLDIMLPKKDGYEVLKEIRRNNKKLPVIMLTARAEEIDKLLGLEMGADDYITKPFSMRELAARIKAVLRRTYFDYD